MTKPMIDTHVRELFRKRFGTDPEIVGVAPGRINLIGEHTDYNDGFVFPAAIDKVVLFAASRIEGPTQLFSEEIGEAEPFDVSTTAPGSIMPWGVYPAGMAWALRDHGPLPNLKGVITSTIPSSGGVSSSAALEMAFGVVWNELAGLGLSNKQLALLGQRCENGFVGVNSGIMDQMASAMGRLGHAMFLDTRSLDIEYAPIPAGLSAVLCDTKKPRALTGSAYNERRSQCEEASRVVGVAKLRDATLNDLKQHKSDLGDVVYRRAKHVVTEDDRCVSFKAVLEKGDTAAIGRLMRESHESLRDDYEVSCFELDVMAEAAWKAPGCVGARMMGGGFGGSCVALVETSHIDAFISETLRAYENAACRKGEAMACGFVDGARILAI